jgi:hypothetical protein
VKNKYETPKVDIVVFKSSDVTNVVITSAVIGAGTTKFKYNEIEEIN